MVKGINKGCEQKEQRQKVVTKKRRAAEEARAVEVPKEVAEQLASFAERAESDPANALTEAREFVSANFGLGTLPLKSTASRIQLASNLLAEWMFYCAEDLDSKAVPSEIDQLVECFKTLKTIHTDTEQRYLSIIADWNAGMSNQDVLMKWDLAYNALIQNLLSATEIDKPYWQGEADAQAARFWDNLRKAEGRLGVKREKMQVSARKRTSKYRKTKEN